MNPISVLMYGVGVVARTQMVRQMIAKGVDVVAAVSRSRDIGRDLGEVCGLERRLGVLISNDLESAIADRNIDIAIHAVTNALADSYDHIASCVDKGINVLTIGTQAFYPWNCAPRLAEKLDQRARDKGVTVAASGFQDFYWANMVTQLAGTSHRIESISGTARFNINEFGPEVAGSYFVGNSRQTFDEKIYTHGCPANTLKYCAELICADMGLEIDTIVDDCQPIIAEVDTPARSLGKTIPAGRLIGCTSISEIKTLERIALNVRYMRKCYQQGEHDINRWSIKGDPDIFLEMIDPPTEVATASTTVNRIPDVINAAPGFITCDRLPKLRYRARPLHEYLNS